MSIRAILAAAAVLGAAGCAAERGGPAAGADRLPNTPVEDLNGGTVALSSLTPARRPVLLWVWGPG